VTDAMFRALVVEDDADIRNVVGTLLASQGFRISSAATATRALVEARAQRPDLVIVDLGLPDLDGHAVIARLREFTPAPILVLSARTAETEKIRALDQGADDYVTKPFSAGELLARVRAALRRRVPPAEPGTRLTVGATVLDLARREATVGGLPVHFTPLEFRVLECLARHRGRVVTHEQLLREVWGPAHAGDTRGLRAYVKMLRDKLEPDPAEPRHLLTEPGVGYRLADA
jgi:two-component system KDP operon response regulator KdpE